MSQFIPSYFDKNLRRLLGLKVFSMNNEHMDVIQDKNDIRSLISDGLKIKGSHTPMVRAVLRDTINSHFGGLKRIRAIPLWKLHIDIAMALFNNRFQTVSYGVKKNLINDPEAIMSELLDYNLEPQLDLSNVRQICKAEQSRKNKGTKAADDYRIACCLLSRIPALDREEVKELCAFIIEWICTEYKKQFDKSNRIDKTSIVTTFNNDYNYDFVDLGPESEVLNNIEMSEDALNHLYQVWETIDDDLPVLHPNFVKEVSVEEEQSPAEKHVHLDGHPSSTPSVFNESGDEEEVLPQQHIRDSGTESIQNDTLLPDPLALPNDPSSSVTSAPSQIHPHFWTADSTEVPPATINPSRQVPADRAYYCSAEVHSEKVEVLENRSESLVQKDTQTSKKNYELVKRLSKLNDARESSLDEKEKLLEKKEKILDEREKSLQLLKKKLEDRKKREDEREKSQNERERSQNAREKSQNERERLQIERQKFFNKQNGQCMKSPVTSETDESQNNDADDEEDTGGIDEIKNKILKRKLVMNKYFKKLKYAKKDRKKNL